MMWYDIVIEVNVFIWKKKWYRKEMAMRKTFAKLTTLILLVGMLTPMLLVGCNLIEDSHVSEDSDSVNEDAVDRNDHEIDTNENENDTDDNENDTDKEVEVVKVGLIDESMFVKQDGRLLKTAAGDTIYLRGINAGGVGAIEGWMQTAFVSNTQMTTRNVTDLLMDRFGEKKTLAFWKEYRKNWWNDADFKHCRDMGINVIRLPITYMQVDPAANRGLDYAGKQYDFSMVDDFVTSAAEYGIYTIIDLHGAYGSQNGLDHSGEIVDLSHFDFYNNDRKMQLTVDLWRAMAKHFNGNPAVAGYDVLNEPGERLEGGYISPTKKYHWDFMDRIYDAIREVDPDHLVIIETMWTPKDLPNPADYGWTNVMYSMHNYTECYGDADFEKHKSTIDNKVQQMVNCEYNVPWQMGEFTCYDNKAQWEYTLNAFNEGGIHWCNWNYKLNNPHHKMRFWGAVNVHANGQIDLVNDSYEDILAGLSVFRTDGEHASIPTFEDGTTLTSVIKTYAVQK